MKTGQLPLLHRRGGYEIRGDGERIVFVVRSTYGAGIGAAVCGGIAGILLINAAMQFFLMESGFAPYLAVPGVVALAFFILCMRTFLRRKKADPDDVPVRYCIDLGARTLSDASGAVLAGLDGISFTCGYNFLSRTYGLTVVLPSKMTIKVYAEWVMGFSSAHVRAVRDEMERAVAVKR